jgi:hypothetical protein
MSETLEGFPGVLCHMDDVLVCGSSHKEHDERREKVLSVFEFSKPSV